MATKANEKQRLTLLFLQKKEREEKEFSDFQLAKASTYPLGASLRAKLSRNEFGEFIIKQPNGLFKAQHTLGLNLNEYALKVSSKYRHANPVKHSTSNSSLKLSDTLVDKSVQAVLAAIEIYNKPDFGYREETFSILLINAWEILLKAKVVRNGLENMESLYIPDKNTIGNFVKSRSGNYRTITIGKAINLVALDETLKANLFVLVELRDNAIHFRNESPILNTKLLEVGTASLLSYLEMCKEWFKKDLSKYNFYIMPMSFFHPHELQSYSVNNDSIQNQNLLRYIGNKEKKFPHDPLSQHSVSLRLETKFVKSKMQIDPDDPDAISVIIEEEDIFTKTYTWACKENLVPELKKRYNDFKVNPHFWSLLKELKENPKFCRVRYLNTKTKKGSKQEWYNPNIVHEIDRHYTKK
ncbi:DUF3644 domain-containing protein [uncultured Maribacter sp.]|uniref:DUF3644 domain-containing protein n=1 Tax=uncultured Maribacter sp. TaxID=431308 RepID=UPI0030EE1B2F|tara:strand:+ start:219 stop:1454 length:1236 start_codon:yes stop_codon:yes gene_type:complete